MEQKYTVGGDVGSTTVKCILLDEKGDIVHSVYGMAAAFLSAGEAKKESPYGLSFLLT